MTIDEESSGMNTNSQAQAWLLFTDDTGQAYLLPHEILEQARLSEEQRAALHEQLADDVLGNIQDVSERPVALRLGLQAVLPSRLVLAGFHLPNLPGAAVQLQGLQPCI